MDLINALERVVISIKAWVDAKKADIPKVATITLSTDSWIGSSNIWSQVVVINSVTNYSKIDLLPTAAQIADLQDCDITLVVENEDGVITVYAIGNKPEQDYTMQVFITEVAVV